MSKTNTHEIKISYQPSSTEISVGLGNTALQADKELRREAFRRGHRKQDHGDAATGDGHFKDEFERSYEERGAKKRTRTELREAREETDDYLNSLTPAELQALADEILGEQSEDELVDYEVYMNGMPFSDEEEDDRADSSIVRQGRNLSSQLHNQKRARRADSYETRSHDDGDYGNEDVLAGMSIREGRIGQ